MNDYQLTYFYYNRTSILVEWPSQIDTEILEDVLLFKNSIEENYSHNVVQVINAYHSLLIIYTSAILSFDDQVTLLRSIYQKRSSIGHRTRRLWKIPVCYDPVFGIDLAEISEEKKCSIAELIRWHSEVSYQIYFIGFLPGFLYLGGLNARLNMPRKESPRQRVKRGAVAIGGHQTGIYPNDSPGGWNIIGNSPIEFFNANSNPPCFARGGDELVFVPISLKDHKEILSQVADGTYNLESEVING